MPGSGTNAHMTEISPATYSIAAMLEGYSIEAHPGEKKVIHLAAARLDPGTEVFLTWIPGTNPIDMVAAAARLRHSGLVPVPHVAARHVETAGQLQELAARLTGEAGVDRILIIGGDRPKPAGPYDSTLAVMQTGVFQKAGIFRIAVAGFPEGNPHIPENLLEEALAAKVKDPVNAIVSDASTRVFDRSNFRCIWDSLCLTLPKWIDIVAATWRLRANKLATVNPAGTLASLRASPGSMSARRPRRYPRVAPSGRD